MSDTDESLLRQCRAIAQTMSDGPSVEWAEAHGVEVDHDDDEPILPSAYDWLASQTYDTEIVVGLDGEFRGAACMVAGGGPTIWVDFHRLVVVGTWASAPVTVPFIDAWDIEEALQEQWEASR